jgi:hypothetical protein
VVRRLHTGVVLRRLLIVSGLAVSVVVLGAGGAHAQSGSSWCSQNGNVKPCVVSATYDGNALSYSDPNYDVYAINNSVDGAKGVLFGVEPALGGPSDLSAALGKTFSIQIETYGFVPRVIDGFGTAMSYARECGGCGAPTTGWVVTITGRPVEVSDQANCSFPSGGPTCTGNAPGSNAIFQGEMSDYNYSGYHDPSYPAGFVDSFKGMDMYTNIAETGLPPNLIQSNGQNELELDLTDYHFEHDGTTPVRGDFYLRIPATFLATYWGINDPATLATDGLNASIGAGGGTLSVTVEPANTGVRVRITGMTFSRRKLKIKLGRVTPHAPTHVKARRLSRTSARVTFHAAKPRGQKVKGYQVSCTPGYHAAIVTAKSKHSPLTITGLGPEAYNCTLRARSKAGYGAWSRGFSILP